MSSTQHCEGPAVLQLHRWDRFKPQIDLSEFKDASISPTRELLLLLSYQREAMLIPLVRGYSLGIGEQFNYEHQDTVDSSSSSFLTEHDRSQSCENTPSTSESAFRASDGTEINSFPSNDYPFVCDINSLAWGVCGDTYGGHEEALFRELLFVCGGNGVTVHAFRQVDESCDGLESSDEGGGFNGNWVEWSYSGASLCDSQINGDVSNSTTPGIETPGNLYQKKWLKSFLIPTETRSSNGIIRTLFPQQSMIPISAKVVSFHLFESIPCIVGFLSRDKAAEDSYRTADSGMSNPDNSADPSSSYHCTKVFSSNSHHLIGFVLNIVEGPTKTSLEADGNRCSKVVLVARLDRCWLQWLCSVNLDPKSFSSEDQWTDFQFYDNLLVCLQTSGLIFFYGAATGEYDFHLDVLQIYGFRHEHIQEEKSKESNIRTQNGTLRMEDTIDCNLHSQAQRNVRKRSFRRLIVASSSSLLALVDDCGVVYVLHAADHVTESTYLSNKLLLPYLRIGVGSPWHFGNSDISCQNPCFRTTGSQASEKLSLAGNNSLYMNGFSKIESHNIKNWCPRGLLNEHDLLFSGFSGFSQKNFHKFLPSRHRHLMRNLFLPVSRTSPDDCISLSSLGITRLLKMKNAAGNTSLSVVHANFYVESSFMDNGHQIINKQCQEVIGEGIGCIFQGCLCLVTGEGISVILPPVSIPSEANIFEPIDIESSKITHQEEHVGGDMFRMRGAKPLLLAWKMRILDKVLLFEGPDQADDLCLANGWDIKVSRLRRLDLSLAYLKFAEMGPSLEMLAGIHLAEEGILRMIFAAVYVMLHRGGNDNEASAASKILALASQFAIKTIREYATLELKKSESTMQCWEGMKPESKLPCLPYKEHDEVAYSRKLNEMAHYLEIIRNFQCRLAVKFKRLGQGLDEDEHTSMDIVSAKVDSQLSGRNDATASKETQDETTLSLDYQTSEQLTLMPSESFSSPDHLKLRSRDDDASLLPPDVVSQGNHYPVENPKEMIARWELDNLDLRTVVRDALLSGRLPLAVLQLHLHRLKDVGNDNEPNDTFSEVRDVGRALAYDLFLKGETGLAMSTLQRLGEDVEACLKQLVFGTISRSLRRQITSETKKYGFLKSYELAVLEKISLIERLYPSCRFWKTYHFHKKTSMEGPELLDSPSQNGLRLIHSYAFQDLTIECGEVDGVVLGSWTNFETSYSTLELDEEDNHAGYWAAAAVWANAWDQTTIDRILLDQPFFMGVHVMWESQLDYHLCHNDWEETCKLLEMIPNSVLSAQSLQVCMDSLHQVSSTAYDEDFPNYGSYVSSPKELDSVYAEIPSIRLLKCSAFSLCSVWLRMNVEKELAKKLIFLKEFWDGTAEIVPLMAQSGLISEKKETFVQDELLRGSSYLDFVDIEEELQPNAMQGFHKLIIRHCVLYNLPCFLDLYLDHHKLVLNKETLSCLREAAGDSSWANWLLFYRIKGHEYDASFSNARAILSKGGIVCDDHLTVSDMNDVVHTVDNIAEGGWLMAALATLMFAPLPIQNCLSSGSVKIRCSSSAQCTLENLRPALQRFPTLWNVLFAASLGQDTSDLQAPKLRNAHGNSAISVLLNWRDSVFYSSGRDASLLQMLPCWFPKLLRRLTQLFVQGPLGWQAMADPQNSMEFFTDHEEASEFSIASWEAAIQKQIEQELYASSVKESGLGLEHHLLRGCGLAAFNHFIGYRVEKLKTEDATRGESTTSLPGQANVQTHMQTLLAPLEQNENPLLSSVMPLAITNYQNSVVVASCTFLLELCGLPANILRVSVAVLRRISHFYESKENVVQDSSLTESVTEEGTVDSLAQALADYYIHKDTRTTEQNESPKSFISKQPSRALLLVLQHLEKASLPAITDGQTCGSWLLSAKGDGNELRSQQKTASQSWNLVTIFCQMHQLPLSTKYLALLARDNDWVGFLSEAQTAGYPFETVIQVAAKDFSDRRLRTHILTVLKSISSKKKLSSVPSADGPESLGEAKPANKNIYIPVELFGILAECEIQKYPGKALLMKAKKMSWALLAIIASCFADVSPIYCLAVWLEITAARDATLTKIDNIASQLASIAGTAVDAVNSLPASGRVHTYHYNRKNPKRQRLIDPVAEDSSPVTTSKSSSVHVKSIIEGAKQVEAAEHFELSSESDDWAVSLPKMVALLCEQGHFLPLLRAFEMFLPSCSLLPFIRALQAFSQMRLSEASTHLSWFSSRIREEPFLTFPKISKDGQPGVSWISSTARRAADSMILTCPSAYERRCLLELLVKTDFGDGGSASKFYGQKLWKINLAEPELRKDGEVHLGNERLDDDSLLSALEKNGHWELAHQWAQQLEATESEWKSAFHRVTETQAESMVSEWKEFLWDVPEERVALWGHCQTLFIRRSFPPLQAGLFFLKHAEAVEKDLPPRELHELLLLSLQWLSGMITQSYPVYPLHLLREIETRAWLLAVESEAQAKSERDFDLTCTISGQMPDNSSNIIDRTANIVMKMDNHINCMRERATEKADAKDSSSAQVKSPKSWETGSKAKRRAKASGSPRQSVTDTADRICDSEDCITPPSDIRHVILDDSSSIEASFSRWEERIGPAELERAVLSLLEFGQITAAKQLQHKLSPGNVPSEFKFVDAALKLAEISTPFQSISVSLMDEDLRSLIQPYSNLYDNQPVEPLQVLENLSTVFAEGCGRGLCKKIIAVIKAANILGISFSEAFGKKPTELLQLLSLKAQESYEEARLLIQTHSMPASSIAQILAESFLKGLLAAHRGGYIDCQKEEGPAPLLWRFSDFLKWAELCPSEPEIGHALMRIVITGQEIPHACEVELLILSHHFYKSSTCLDGVDVLVSLAATRVDAYVSEGDFSCLARLVTGVGNFHALNFVLGILIENGQLDLLLQKYSAADSANNTADGFRGFRMAVLTALMHFNPDDLDAFAMVYNHFDMKHETASLLLSRAEQAAQQWIILKNKYNNEDLLESMRYYIEAAEVHSSVDAGNKTRTAFAQASLVSLQIRMPDFVWLHLSETNARYALVSQSQFQEALIVAEAYNLNHPGEWALALWERMVKPELEEYVAEFVAVLPLQPSMLADVAKFYRIEVAARGEAQFSVWGTAEWAKNLERSFRCLLKRTRDLRVRFQLATTATGFADVLDSCNKALDKIPENAGQIVLRKGHGGAYLPLM